MPACPAPRLLRGYSHLLGSREVPPLAEGLESPLNLSGRSKLKSLLLPVPAPPRLLRDYFQLEFQGTPTPLPFPFDLERVSDDFVLFCMLVGAACWWVLRIKVEIEGSSC